MFTHDVIERFIPSKFHRISVYHSLVPGLSSRSDTHLNYNAHGYAKSQKQIFLSQSLYGNNSECGAKELNIKVSMDFISRTISYGPYEL